MAEPAHQVPGASAMLARLSDDRHTVAFAYHVLRDGQPYSELASD